jgi:hypothetical protein
VAAAGAVDREALPGDRLAEGQGPEVEPERAEVLDVLRLAEERHGEWDQGRDAGRVEVVDVGLADQGGVRARLGASVAAWPPR